MIGRFEKMIVIGQINASIVSFILADCPKYRLFHKYAK